MLGTEGDRDANYRHSAAFASILAVPNLHVGFYQKTVRQVEDVISLPEGRQGDHEFVQAVVNILAEPAGLYLSREGGIGGGDECVRRADGLSGTAAGSDRRPASPIVRLSPGVGRSLRTAGRRQRAPAHSLAWRSHVGLLCTAGMLNGIFGEGEMRHIAHWQSVKLVDKSEEEEDGRRSFERKSGFRTNGRWSFAQEKSPF